MKEKKQTTDSSLEKALKRFTTQERNWIDQGKQMYVQLQDRVTEALMANRFNEHYFIYSQPGFSKTYSTKKVCELNKIKAVKMDGSLGLFAFAADLAYVLISAPKGKSKIPVIFDDCDSLFDKNNINVIKGMFDSERNILGYGKALGAQYHGLSEIQQAAIDEFRCEERSGFQIPTDRFTFITLTNRPLATGEEAENASDSKRVYKTDQAAVRRRVRYIDLSMDPEVAWGYCAYVVLAQGLIEKHIPKASLDLKLEMLTWSSPLNKWSKISDRNLSLFEKMTKDYIMYPENYLDYWHNSYVKTK